MKIISLFNNKGGVGKTTLAFHLSWILSEMGKKVLMIDLDPKCNLTICGINECQLEKIWQYEDPFIDDYENAAKSLSKEEFSAFNQRPHTIHYLLKPTEDGLDEIEHTKLTPTIKLNPNLNLIPGRLTINRYENVISERWSQIYQGVPLSIRTITRIRSIAETYAERDGYDFVIIDTSPSLGALNKVIISTVDGFIIPCLPDMFSLYGIQNIGNSLKQWQKEFNGIYHLISEEKRMRFPKEFVQFLGYTIYNAKKYTKPSNPWDLAQAHYNYALQIPRVIEHYIIGDVRKHLNSEQTQQPIGGTSVMHSHNTLPAMSQKYKRPIWEVPDYAHLDSEDRKTIQANAGTLYYPAKEKYRKFAEDFLSRIECLNEG